MHVPLIVISNKAIRKVGYFVVLCGDYSYQTETNRGNIHQY